MGMSEEQERRRDRDAKLHLLTEMIRVMATIMEPETEVVGWSNGAGVLEEVTAIGDKRDEFMRFTMDGSRYLMIRWKKPLPPGVVEIEVSAEEMDAEGPVVQLGGMGRDFRMEPEARDRRLSHEIVISVKDRASAALGRIGRILKRPRRIVPMPDKAVHPLERR